MYTESILRVDGVLSSAKRTFSFAAQRFDTILQVTENLVLHIQAVLSCLTELQAKDKTMSAWASDMLGCLTPDRLVLIALLAELSRCAARFVHRHDASSRKDGVTSLASSARAFGQLKGRTQPPLFLQEP